MQQTLGELNTRRLIRREGIGAIATRISPSRISSGGSWPRLELLHGIPTQDTSSSRRDTSSTSAWHANLTGGRVIQGVPDQKNTHGEELFFEFYIMRK